MTFLFSTKARNLEQLSGVCGDALVKPLYILSWQKWRQASHQVLEEIAERFQQTIIVRSSAQSEDSLKESKAGVFLSKAGISSINFEECAQAIKEVFESYGNPQDTDELFIQEQILDIRRCGVLFTRDLEELGPYFVINFDESGSHVGITSGTASKNRMWTQFRGSRFDPPHPWMKRLIELGTELEQLCDCDHLDIEFAFDSKEKLYLLQVRPIVSHVARRPTADAEIARLLADIEAKIQSLDTSHPRLCGDKAIYSVMTDWNPAEIIGIKPGTLALSLYKEMITDSIWAYQRDNYGYRNLRSFPLLISFMGFPYIDVRASLNSFVPKGLDESLAAKLVNYYLETLCDSPHDHDKVEFKIVFSCYDLTLPERIQTLHAKGFSINEIESIKSALLKLTNSIVDPHDGHFRSDLDRINQLELRFNEIVSSQLDGIDKIYWLIEDCKRYGTLPFAGIARAAFISMQFLHSFVALDILSEQDLESFLGSLNTITRKLSADVAALSSKELSKQDFLNRYGHLRPGTYDILSRRYDEAFDIYFGMSRPACAYTNQPSFQFSPSQRAKITEALAQNGIAVSVDQLLGFIVQAIEGREYSKYVFTKSLSYSITLIEKLGVTLGISRPDLAYLDVRVLLDLYATLDPMPVADLFRSRIEKNRQAAAQVSSLKLPSFIASTKDLYGFYCGEAEPNFITRTRATREIVLESRLLDTDLSNKIVFIASADPGYDWLFSQKISGLVTMFGGANSHMAIRCSELQIPAVIGCGEGNFRAWSAAKLIELDCAARQVRTIR